MDGPTLNDMISEYENGVRAAANAAAASSEKTKPEEHTILFLSRTLRPYEKNYTILELEMGAVVWAVLKLQSLPSVPVLVFSPLVLSNRVSASAFRCSFPGLCAKVICPMYG